MKKILFYSLVLSGLFVGCSKDITTLNENPKNPAVVPANTVFTYAQKEISSGLASANVNLNIFRLIVQFWTETTYTDESNYDLNTRNIPNGYWGKLYRDVLKSLKDAKGMIPTTESNPTTKIVYQNQSAIIDIMTVYTYHYIFTTFGNAPYTEALNISNSQPKYDDAKTTYAALLAKLSAAINNLDVSNESFGTADLYYAGDVAKWKKFAASLKLKMAMLISDYDLPAATTAVQEAITTGVFTSNTDNAKLVYLATTPNTNPIWVDLIQSGRHDFVVTNTIVNYMNNLNDPRMPIYFTKVSGSYVGGTPGIGNSFSTKSGPGTAITDETHPYTLLDYAEVEFLLAEAAARGMAVSGTAQSHYNAAITASILDWGGTAGDAATYIAQAGVVYDAVNWKKSIGNQKWLALFDRGQDAWTEWRRLDYPTIVAPASAISVTPLRFTYPVSEQNLNQTNYNAASTAIGGDKVSTKLWFDVN